MVVKPDDLVRIALEVCRNAVVKTYNPNLFVKLTFYVINRILKVPVPRREDKSVVLILGGKLENQGRNPDIHALLHLSASGLVAMHASHFEILELI